MQLGLIVFRGSSGQGKSRNQGKSSKFYFLEIPGNSAENSAILQKN